MQLKFQLEDDLVCVSTEGRITQQRIDPSSEPLAGLLGPAVYSRKVLLNLSNSDYIDSSGVSWLLTCHKRCREAGGMLIIHSPSPMVVQILRVLRMDQVLTVADDILQARALANGTHHE